MSIAKVVGQIYRLFWCFCEQWCRWCEYIIKTIYLFYDRKFNSILNVLRVHFCIQNVLNTCAVYVVVHNWYRMSLLEFPRKSLRRPPAGFWRRPPAGGPPADFGWSRLNIQWGGHFSKSHLTRDFSKNAQCELHPPPFRSYTGSWQLLSPWLLFAFFFCADTYPPTFLKVGGYDVLVWCTTLASPRFNLVQFYYSRSLVTALQFL